MSLHLHQLSKPVEELHISAIEHGTDEAEKRATMQGLEALVEHSINHPDQPSAPLTPMDMAVTGVPWLKDIVPWLEALASRYHVGNYVIIRDTGEKIFESMPIYARLGMYLLFHGNEERRLAQIPTVEKLLREQSIKQGKIYDSPESVSAIPSFVSTYSLDLKELLESDIKKYACFNDFFSRRLKPNARPVQNASNPNSFCSSADCRLTVYQTVSLAREFWIKGHNFNIPLLLHVSPTSERALAFENSSLAIFRLAPADYHRFHSPLDGVVKEIVSVPGQYYTVNPQAINQTFDVLTANTRSVMYLTHTQTGREVAFVAIGALLVGSVKWTHGENVGMSVNRGDELGNFAYGGSTVVVVFPRDMIEFDEDLVQNSKTPIETLVKVGYSLGCAPGSVKETPADKVPASKTPAKGWRKKFGLKALKKRFSLR